MESCSYQPMLRDIQAVGPPVRLGSQECVPMFISEQVLCHSQFLRDFLMEILSCRHF